MARRASLSSDALSTADGQGSAVVLSVRDLRVGFRRAGVLTDVVDEVTFDLHAGETLGIVGESGSGKSVTVLSLLGLVPRRTAEVSGHALLEGSDLLAMDERQLRRVRGRKVGVIFQDPMTSLNPVFTLGAQIAEAVRLHDKAVSRRQAWSRAVELLKLVGVGNPEGRAKQYPHEFSGGMRQRAMIAIAIANRPAVLIADEPTTALDVTIQAQVMDVLEAAQRETGAAVILITHDLGLVSESADRIAVMYCGRIVELGSSQDVLEKPRHPYSKSLIDCLPSLDTASQRLKTIPGEPPAPGVERRGCSFVDRCWMSRGRQACLDVNPELSAVDATGHTSACHFYSEVALQHGAQGREDG